MQHTYQIDSDIRRHSPRVFEHRIHHQKVFVKQQKQKTKKHMGHRLQYLLYRITRNPMLIPTVLSAEENDILFQVEKLNKYKKAGLNVPQVLHVEPDYFVMESVGEDFVAFIKKSPSHANHYLQKSFEQLCRLHQNGYAHGGSQIRNFTIKDSQVFMIDFEEKIPPEYIKEFQLRDILLYLLSIKKYGLPVDIKKLCSLYKQNMNRDIHEEIKRFLLPYHWISFLNHPTFKKIQMKDIRDFTWFLQQFQQK